MSDMLHPFEAAGLGRAPFRVVRLETREDRASDNAERKSAGKMYTDNHCTSCDYCSTAIYNAYHIRSADGRTFKVGCDCLKKVDAKLESSAKRIARARRAELIAEKAMRERDERLARQREVNGGYTDAELASQKNERDRLQRSEAALQANGWIIDRVKDDPWGGLENLWTMPIHHASQRYQDVVRSIWLKTYGRYGSKAYKAAEAVWDENLSRLESGGW